MRLNLMFAITAAMLFACSGSDGGNDAGEQPPLDAVGDLTYDVGEEPDVPLEDGEEPAEVPAEVPGDLGPDAHCDYHVSPNGFRDNCDGTITDTRTGLMWSRTSVAGNDRKQLAQNCNQQQVGGHDGWRLANIDQLRGILLGCDETAAGGACGVTVACTEAAGNAAAAKTQCFSEADCGGCGMKGGPGYKGCYTDVLLDDQCHMVISDTKMSKALKEEKAWYVTFYDGRIDVNEAPITAQAFGRCVRVPPVE